MHTKSKQMPRNSHIIVSASAAIFFFYLLAEMRGVFRSYRNSWRYRWKQYLSYRLYLLLLWLHPSTKKRIQKQIIEMRTSFAEERFKHLSDWTYQPLQDHATPTESIMKTIRHVSSYELKSHTSSGAMYLEVPESMRKMVGEIHERIGWITPTHPDIWPWIVQIEAELLRICCDLFHAGPGSRAVFTGGGTMSNLHAIYTYRQWAREINGVTKPNIVLPETGHVSFNKAGTILGVEVRMVPVHKYTGEVDTRKLEEAIDSNTICLIGSAPCFSSGLLDPIHKMGVLAHKHVIGFHVDACLGGFHIPFMESAGYYMSTPPDFRTKYITSISADTHKFGCCPKGSSVLMFANRYLRDFLTFVDVNWSGGVYATPSMPGSRSGADIVASWAVVRSIGYSGYVERTKKTISLQRQLVEKIASVDAVRVVGMPQFSTFELRLPFGSKLNIHQIGHLMEEKGWNFNTLPTGIHFCVTEKHWHMDNFVNRFIECLTWAIGIATESPDPKAGSAAEIYCSSQKFYGMGKFAVEEAAIEYYDVMQEVQPGD